MRAELLTDNLNYSTYAFILYVWYNTVLAELQRASRPAQSRSLLVVLVLVGSGQCGQGWGAAAQGCTRLAEPQVQRP